MSESADHRAMEHLMTDRNMSTEVLGFLRTDLLFLVRCLEGALGEGRVTEAAPQAAAFIRAALAVPTLLPAPGDPLPRLLGGRPPTPDEATVIQQERGMLLSEREAQQIQQERVREARNRGDDEEDGNGGIPT
jgi:hypothetical protein